MTDILKELIIVTVVKKELNNTRVAIQDELNKLIENAGTNGVDLADELYRDCCKRLKGFL